MGAKIGFGLGAFADVVTYLKYRNEAFFELPTVMGTLIANVVLPFGLALGLGFFGLVIGAIVGPPLKKTDS